MAMGEVDQDDYPYHTTALVTTILLTRPLKEIMDVVEREHIPSYNFRPKEEDIILDRAEGETYFSRARVVKMPSQAIVTVLTSSQFVVPQMVWSQDPQTGTSPMVRCL